MPKVSAGLLVYRRREQNIELLLVHPGGPFWTKKDLGAWTIPKGELEEGEAALDTARREFTEETGFVVDGPFEPLGQVRQAGGKIVQAWAVERDLDPAAMHSNTFDLEWPPRSGRIRQFPEVDAAQWFSPAEALDKLNPAQQAFVARLLENLGRN